MTGKWYEGQHITIGYGIRKGQKAVVNLYAHGKRSVQLELETGELVWYTVKFLVKGV